MKNELKDILDQVLITHSPGGWEEEMDEIIIEELSQITDEIHKDDIGNIFIRFKGRKSGPLTVISAHKDELAVMVRKIDDNGRIWLEPNGNIRPMKYGEGPYDLITENKIIPGILHIGSSHSSELSKRIHKSKTEALTWELVYLDCKLDAEELKAQGAAVGDWACVARSRKQPMYLHDKYVSGYALDDKAAVAILFMLIRKFKDIQPYHDTVFAFTSEEEAGVTGAQYLSRTLKPQRFIALEVAPVAEEYPIEMNDMPVVLFKDGAYQYNMKLSRALISAGEKRGIECQRAVIRTFGSDASITAIRGLTAEAACLCFPTENTHGYEITSLMALENCVELLHEYLERP